MKLGEVDRKTSARPLRRELVHQPVRSSLWNRAQGFLQVVFPNRFKPRLARSQPAAVYAAPRVTKLTTEQAKLKLLGHLSVGDQGARDLLDLLFYEPAANSGTREHGNPPVRS